MPDSKEQIADEFGPVYAVCLPVNFPHTGRYALFRPLGEKRFPNFEDNILICRVPGGKFEVAWSAYIPFDEEPMFLWDNVQSPEQVVLFERYYLAYSLDGAKTIRKPTESQQKAVGYGLEGRWSEVGIVKGYIRENRLLVKTYPFKHYIELDRPNAEIEVTSWSIPIEEDGAPARLGTTLVRSTWGVPERTGNVPEEPLKTDSEGLLKTNGERLWARSVLTEKFAPVPLMRLAQQLAKTGRVDFFGGSGARSFF